MKLNLKLVAIFIILIYTLSPLAAIDMDQNCTDESNESIDHGEKIIRNNTEEEISTNETGENNIPDNFETTDNNLTMNNNETPRLQGIQNLKLNFYVIEDPVPYRTAANVYITTGATSQIKLDCKITGPNYERTSSITVPNTGNTMAKLLSNLEEGEYTMTLSYAGDWKYNSAQVTKTFRVAGDGKIYPELGISADDIYEGDDAKIIVTANETLTGNMDLTLNNSAEKHNVDVVNGHGTATISNLPIGKYQAKVTFAGNDKFKPGEQTTTFNVKKAPVDPNLSVNVEDIYEGSNANIVVTANEAFSGTVDLTLSNSDTVYQVNVVNGHGTKTISNLPAGQYQAKVTFAGNEQFKPSEKTTTFNVKEKIDPNLSVNVEDIYEGSNANIVVTANQAFSGTVDLTLSNSDTVYQVNVVNGHGTKTISNLPAGQYQAKVTFKGNEQYKASEKTTTFNVKEKIDPNLSIKVEDIYEGSKAEVMITANNAFTGTVDVTLNNGGTVYNVNVVNGQGTTTISNLPAGKYQAKVTYAGNEQYKASEKTTTFNVKEKIDPSLSIKVEDIYEGDKAEVMITANNAFTGTVDVTLNNTSTVYHVNVVNGQGTTTISNLPAGKYQAKVTYAGNEQYKASEKTTTFNVKNAKIDPNLSIKVDDIYEGNDTTVIVTANETLTATMDVTLNNTGTVYHVNVVNGHGTTTISNLPPGKYQAKVTYAGNEQFKPSEKTTTFNVKKLPIDPSLSIKVEDIYEGNDAKIIVTANETLTGSMDVTLNNSANVYHVNVVNGHGTTTISNLAVGKYQAKVTFAGNEQFKPSEKTTTFNVKEKIDPSLSIKVEDIYEGSNANVIVTANETLTATMDVTLNNTGTVYHVNVVNGQGTITISNLPAGKYQAKVTFAGDNKFKASEKTTTFNVKEKIDPNLNIKVDDIYKGDKAEVIISTNDAISATMDVSLNNSGEVYHVNVVNGLGKVSISNLPIGHYQVKVTYAGNEQYKASEKTTTFNVKGPIDPNLNIKVDDIYIGDHANIIISANETLSGTMDVTLNHSRTVYHVNVVNGHGSISIYNLPIGEYQAKVTYAGSNKFIASEKTTTFKVKDGIDPNLSIKVDDIYVGNDTNIIISANETLSGTMDVSLNNSGEVYHVNVVDGHGNLSISNLPAGKYQAKVTFAGVHKFKSATATATFAVKNVLKDPNLKISVKSSYKSVKPVVTVTTDKAFSGNIKVKIASKNYNVKVVNGKGTLTIPVLKVGSYTATATFAKTNVFKDSTKSTTFKVKADVVKLTVNKVKVKQSAKKLTIKSKLKINGKLVKGKKVIFKFKGKKYTAKTNKKGIAKITIKKSVLKKLKVGKKIKYSVKYSTKTVKKTVKVKSFE